MRFFQKKIIVILHMIATLCTFLYKSTTISCVNAEELQQKQREFVKINKIPFEDIKNNQYVFHDYLGNYLIIYFWATWCLECIKDLKKLDTLQDMLITDEIENFKVLPISMDFTDNQVVENLFKSIDIKHLQLFIDKRKKAISFFGVNGPPTLFIVDKHSNIIFRSNSSINFIHPKIYKVLKKVVKIDNPNEAYNILHNGIINIDDDHMIIETNKNVNNVTIMH